MVDRVVRAALWKRVSTEGRGQDPKIQQADLDRICQQRDWTVVKQYDVEESAFGKKPREQFQLMLEDARRGRFDVLVVWSMDRFSREGEWSVSKVMSSLQDWHVQFYSYNEPFLDTTGPFAGFLIPLFAWLAHQESVRKGRAVKLGMEKARAQGIKIGRPRVTDRKGFKVRFGDILERLAQNQVSRRKAAMELKIGYATLKRLIDAQGKQDDCAK
jgi:DNA invertase Pin-like site-specific DNA recombinase